MKNNGQQRAFTAKDDRRTLVITYSNRKWSAEATSRFKGLTCKVALQHQRADSLEAAIEKLKNTLNGWGQAWVELGKTLAE